MRLFRTLTAFRSIKDHPDGKVRGEINKLVHLTGGGKEQVSGCELHALIAVDEPSAAGGNNIEFVARMRLLQVIDARRINLHVHGAMTKQVGKQLSVRRGN